MWNETVLTKLLDIQYPIIQAPMAGGATTPQLIAAVSNCGGLGSLGAGYLSADAIKLEIKRIRMLTKKIFSVNLFAPQAHDTNLEQMQVACDAINMCSSDLNAAVAPMPGPYAPSFEEQISVVLEEKVPVVSFTFGVPRSDIVNDLKSNGTLVMATATTLTEAVFLQENSFDIIVVQGSEAGGHRGSFLDTAEDSLYPIVDLVGQIIKKTELPLIASGGIMNGEAIGRLINLGASGVQLGTAFLCCRETGIPMSYKKLLLNQRIDTTVLTRSFSGKLARGINNKFIRCMENKSASILDYPIQNLLTSRMRKKAKQSGNTDYMSLWAGQAVFLSRALDAQDLFENLVNETEFYLR